MSRIHWAVLWAAVGVLFVGNAYSDSILDQSFSNVTCTGCPSALGQALDEGLPFSGAATIHALGDSSTAGFFEGAGVGPTPRGWDFRVNASGVQVTQLGVNEFLSGFPITLSLWNVSTQTLLALTSVTPAAPQTWAFTNLSTPVSLAIGGIYSVIAWADTTSIGESWYQFSNSPPPSFNPTGTIQYLNTRFDNSVGLNIFPSGTIPAPSSYGVADIGYVSVPEPSTWVMVLIGLVGIGFVRKQWPH
jgi:hypothetical protein